MENLELDKVANSTAAGHYVVPRLDMRNFFVKMNDQRFYNYRGSLTTPTCAEVVNWHVMREVIFISPNNLAKLKAHIGASN